MLRCTELIRFPSSLTRLADAGRNQQSVTERQENPITSNVAAGTSGKPWSMLICTSKSPAQPLYHFNREKNCFPTYRIPLTVLSPMATFPMF